jgi:hypothetical protein
MTHSRIIQLPPTSRYAGQWVFQVYKHPVWVCASPPNDGAGWPNYSSTLHPRFESYDAARMQCFSFFKAYIKWKNNLQAQPK